MKRLTLFVCCLSLLAAAVGTSVVQASSEDDGPNHDATELSCVGTDPAAQSDQPGSHEDGTSSDDSLDGNDKSDDLNGDGGNDTLDGNSGDDDIHGDTGDDDICGDNGDDKLSGGSGDDSIDGGSGDDHISGNAGADTLVGGSGSDNVHGGQGRDKINVRDGKRDRVNCGSGSDSVTADKRDVVAGNCESVRRR